MDMSRAVGFETVLVRTAEIAGIDVLLIRRFDRAADETGRIIRIHQEDLAQALGLPPG